MRPGTRASAARVDSAAPTSLRCVHGTCSAARRDNVVPPSLVEGFEHSLTAKQYQEAYDLAKADKSFLGHVLSAGLSRVSGGYDEAIEAMQEVGEQENLRMADNSAPERNALTLPTRQLARLAFQQFLDA